MKVEQDQSDQVQAQIKQEEQRLEQENEQHDKDAATLRANIEEERKSLQEMQKEGHL